jgi:hypothetical protein
MDTFIRIGFYSFIFYSPILFLLLFIATKKYPGYSIRSQWMSDLGDTRYGSSRLTIGAWVLYGILFFFFAYEVPTVFPHMTASSAAIFLVYMFLFFGFLTCLLPNNMYRVLHYVCVIVAYLSILSFDFLLTYIVLASNTIPKYIIFGTITHIMIAIAFTYAFINVFLKKMKSSQTLYDVIREEKSLLTHNAPFLEWVYILSIVVLFFALSLAALQHIR